MREDDSINKLAEEALNLAVAHIQKELSVLNGDLASHFFSDGRTLKNLEQYAIQELKDKKHRDRERIICFLVSEDIQSGFPTLWDVLHYGHEGYIHWRDEELEEEYSRRKLKIN
jgi:hypothetical protein